MRNLHPLLVLVPAITMALAKPNMTLVRFESSHLCNPRFLEDGQDHTVLTFDVSGNDSGHTYTTHGGPRFYYTMSDGTKVVPCGGFDGEDDVCVKKTDLLGECSCEVHRPGVFRITYTKMAELDTSRGEMFMEWPGPDPSLNIRSGTVNLPEIRGTCPTIAFLGVDSENVCVEGLLVAGKDSTVIRFDVSGHDSIHHFLDAERGPAFYLTTTDGVTHEVCSLFANNSCSNQTVALGSCTCEVKDGQVFRLSLSMPADLYTSEANVSLVWPGDPIIRSDNHSLPLVIEKCHVKAVVIAMSFFFVAVISGLFGATYCLFNAFASKLKIEDAGCIKSQGEENFANDIEETVPSEYPSPDIKITEPHSPPEEPRVESPPPLLDVTPTPEVERRSLAALWTHITTMMAPEKTGSDL